VGVGKTVRDGGGTRFTGVNAGNGVDAGPVVLGGVALSAGDNDGFAIGVGLTRN
jgi:hypothetical protein